MISFNFKNYEEFKEYFGMRKTNEGKMVRKNKIVLDVLKDMFRNKIGNESRWNRFFVEKSMKQPMSQEDLIKAGRMILGGTYENLLADGMFRFDSDIYRVDQGGLCYDGDVKSVRYEKDGHIYKMKASKFYAKIFTEHGLDKFFGQKMQIFCGEKFAEAWTAYAESKVGQNLYTLHYGSEEEDFEKIYSVSDMGSCMSNEGQYYFYVNAVDATAAWLEDCDGNVVCRCVIFNKCVQKDTNKVFRIAERQYAIDQDDKLKNILVARLYAEGLIDAHKRVGAPCNRDGWQKICDKEGNILDNPYFATECNLASGDTLSYQDTFKEYDDYTNKAYNYGSCDYQLDTTDNTFRGNEVYDEWEEEYYTNGVEVYSAYWWDGRGNRQHGDVVEYNIDRHFISVERGEYADEFVHSDDVVCIDGEYWCEHDDNVAYIRGDYYVIGEGCEYCEDSYEYDYDYVEWKGCYYANYSHSELLGEDIPDDLFDEIEEEYAKENGYVKDEDGEWVLAEELDEVCA